MAEESEQVWRCPQCGELIDVSGLGFYADVCCPSCGYAEKANTAIANYRIDGVLGVGGMNVVLRAHDMVLDRLAAIKVLKDTYRNQPERISRFENECAMMAKVRHENVVQVYSAGWDRGQFYIAMELVEGSNLQDLVSSADPLPPAYALEIIRQVALGLEAAGRSGVLHRDMKPGNIIITPEHKAKVLDFGLSLGIKEKDAEELIWGTSFYVSPETLQRKQEDVRTDIYALGMTLRYMLTGIETFPDNPRSLSAILQDKFKLPRLASELPHVDESLCDLVDHMTAYNPDDRPENYRELMTELREVQASLQGGGAEASPELRNARQRKLLLGVGATVAAGIAAAFVTASLASPPPVRSAIAPAERLEWPARDQFKAACDSLAAKGWGEAAKRFSALASTENAEPAMAAFSALAAASLSAMQGDVPGMEASLAVFHTQRERADEASPAAKELLQQLAAVGDALAAPKADVNDIGSPLLEGMLASLLACSYAREGEDEKALAAASRSVGALESAEAPWSGMAEPASGMPEALAAEITEGLMAHARNSIAAHRFLQAEKKLGAYLQRPGLSGERKEEAMVLQEACRVAEAMADMCRMRLPGAYSPGMSPEAMRKAIAGLGIGHLDEEAHALFLLLQGNYAAAFRADPYRAVPASTEPFAILMRDWKNRLGR